MIQIKAINIFRPNRMKKERRKKYAHTMQGARKTKEKGIM